MAGDSICEILNRHRYRRADDTGVWRLSSAPNIGYSDGRDVEERLARAVAATKDRSVDSPEWAAAIIDWPSEYHFSSLRSNLFKPLPIGRGDRVVELGAGCGPITRWLGERGAEVIAVEGSETRAAIAAERCRDLPNVHVVVQNLHEIPPFDADWVTLVGVLEYSRVFQRSADPVAATLNAARKQVSPRGALVVGIENQLGLKYFAGGLEDHLGTRFSGIQGLYREDGPVTFGRRELADRLAAAGLSAQRFLLPWPDYKLPTAVVSEDAAEDPDFDLAAFVARHVARDYHGDGLRAFLEPLVWSVLGRNGLIPDFANSFLVVAAIDDSALALRTPERSTLAWSYSEARRSPLSVITRIVRHEGGLRVLKETDRPGVEPETTRWKHVVTPAVDYRIGESLATRMLRDLAAEDETGFFEAGGWWIDLLLERSCLHDSCRPFATGEWFTDGSALDLIPTNIVVDSSGTLRPFDQEWLCTELVPLLWLVLRGLLRLPPSGVHGTLFRSHSVLDVARKLLIPHGLRFEQSDVQTACDCEDAFQTWVRGIPSNWRRWSEPFLADPGGAVRVNAFELARAFEEACAGSRRELEGARRMEMELRQASARFEEELIRARDEARETREARDVARDEARDLRLVCEDQRKSLDKIERHPIFGPALRGRRRLRNALRSVRSIARL